MKLLYYLHFIGVLFATISCQKGAIDPSDEISTSDTTGNGGEHPRYFFRFKLDGVQKEYKLLSPDIYFALVDAPSEKGTFATLISGNGDEQTMEKSMISFLLDTGINKLKQGVVYTDYPTTQPGHEKLPLLQFVMADENAVGYISWPDKLGDLTPNSRLKITELTKTYVRGTFSGEVFSDLLDINSRRIITEGVFFCEIVQTQ